MPKGPRGGRGPADPIGAAVVMARIATGEMEDNINSGRVQSGKAGGTAHASALSSEQRSAIAKNAAGAR